MPLMGFREYARHRAALGLSGTTLGSVQKAIETKRIAVVVDEAGKKKIDSAAADLAWGANTDPGEAAKSSPTAPTALATDPAAAPNAASAAQTPPAATGGAKSEYLDHRAAREKFAKLNEELDYLTAIGAVVPAEGVRTAAFNAGRELREKIFNIPDRIAPILAAEHDPVKVHLLLTTELKRVLNEQSSQPADAGSAGGHAGRPAALP